jgi:DNA polymerase-1
LPDQAPLPTCAQVLNFSIAYGKTAHGLSRDWGTSLEEAKDTVERWYSDRPEVRLNRTRLPA